MSFGEMQRVYNVALLLTGSAVQDWTQSRNILKVNCRIGMTTPQNW